MSRDIAKTISFAILHITVGFSVTYALTGSIVVATGVALIEPVINSFVFFFHERLWGRISPKARAAPEIHAH